MISIIIASAKVDLLTAVIENINQTIGIPYEILSVENADGKKGICQIYNEGIVKARYDVLCFMHEDIRFDTQDWGRIVTGIFTDNKNIGLLGIAGGKYKALSPSSWFSWLDQYNRFNMVQRYKFSDTETKVVYVNPDNEKLAYVSGLDGVWLCTHKRVTDQVRFDEKLLKGFHGYDVDFSLSVGENWEVAVTYDVLLEHFSEGNYDRNWIESTLLVHEKWKATIPKCIGSISKADALECEKKAFLFLVDQMHLMGYSRTNMWRVLWKSGITANFGWKLFFKLSNYIKRKK